MSSITISIHSSLMLTPIRVKPFRFVLEISRRLILQQPTLCVESNVPTQWKRPRLSMVNFIRYPMVLEKDQMLTDCAVIERLTAIARGNQQVSFTWEHDNIMTRIMTLSGKSTTRNETNIHMESVCFELSGEIFVSKDLGRVTVVYSNNEKHLVIYLVVFPFIDWTSRFSNYVKLISFFINTNIHPSSTLPSS